DNAGYVAPGRARFTSPLVPLRFSPPVHALRPMRLASLACYGGVQDKPRQRFVYLSVHLKRPCGVDGIPWISSIGLSHVKDAFCLYAASLLVKPRPIE